MYEGALFPALATEHPLADYVDNIVKVTAFFTRTVADACKATSPAAFGAAAAAASGVGGGGEEYASDGARFGEEEPVLAEAAAAPAAASLPPASAGSAAEEIMNSVQVDGAEHMIAALGHDEVLRLMGKAARSTWKRGFVRQMPSIRFEYEEQERCATTLMLLLLLSLPLLILVVDSTWSCSHSHWCCKQARRIFPSLCLAALL
jgi:hypothetical protein